MTKCNTPFSTLVVALAAWLWAALAFAQATPAAPNSIDAFNVAAQGDDQGAERRIALRHFFDSLASASCNSSELSRSDQSPPASWTSSRSVISLSEILVMTPKFCPR